MQFNYVDAKIKCTYQKRIRTSHSPFLFLVWFPFSWTIHFTNFHLTTHRYQIYQNKTLYKFAELCDKPTQMEWVIKFSLLSEIQKLLAFKTYPRVRIKNFNLITSANWGKIGYSHHSVRNSSKMWTHGNNDIKT